MQKVDVYASADREVQLMNREIVREFGKLKTAKFDQIHILRDVKRVYRTLERKARKRYRKIAMDSYEIGMVLCGFALGEARRHAKETISTKWVDDLLKEVDPVLMYRFGPEAERKAQRLAETLEAAEEKQSGTQEEIDRAARAWSRQANDFAIETADAAMMEAYEDGGEPEMMWLSERDSRVCMECSALNGKTFPLSQVPYKPHRNCRCRVIPVGRERMVV